MNKAEITALSKIHNARLDNRLKTEALLSALRADEQFAAAENERDSIRFKIVQMRYRNQDFSTLNEALIQAEQKLTARLIALGYKPQDLQPIYNCALCKDSGFVDNKLCKCVTSLAYTLLKDSCSPLITDIDDFGALDYSAIPPPDRERYKISAAILGKFAERFPDNKSNILMLSGKQGTGKSYLMSILTNALMKKCFNALFYNAVKLNEIFLRYHLSPIEEKEDVMFAIINADFLVIDDLGAENLINNVTETYLYELLVLRENKATGITTNMSPSQLLDHYGHRIASRLCSIDSSYIINFEGADLRLIKKQ